MKSNEKDFPNCNVISEAFQETQYTLVFRKYEKQ